MNMGTLTQDQAGRLYRRGNDAGRGYAPYADVAGEDTVSAAVEAAEHDGWTLVHPRYDSSQVAVLSSADGEVMAIGGDAMGRGAWAVMVSDEEEYAL
jgi:hypothetical protein